VNKSRITLVVVAIVIGTIITGISFGARLARHGASLSTTLYGVTFIAMACLSLVLVTELVRQRVRTANAARLSGIVEYEGNQAAGVLVEALGPGWMDKIAEVRTDETGRFELPIAAMEGPQYLRFSWSYSKSLRLKVNIDPNGRPLVVRLRRRGILGDV
jgi:hypothetical protein